MVFRLFVETVHYDSSELFHLLGNKREGRGGEGRPLVETAICDICGYW
jgi:hypothetical protein